MTQLRHAMIRAMELKNLSKNTQRAYLAAVTGLAKHYQQSPVKITDKMIEDYLLYLKNDKGNAPNSCASALSGLRFFYNHVPYPWKASYQHRDLKRIKNQAKKIFT